MTEFVFTSPGVKFRERDLTYVTKAVGVTTLGLVGETLKGPAFEPISIQDRGQFLRRFGAQSIEKFSNGKLKYQLPYSANAYLDESNQLWVTRVLGLSGYVAGNAWVLSLNAGADPATLSGGTPTTTTESFTGNTYMGVSLYITGETGTSFSGLTKTNSTDFSGIKYDFKVVTITGNSGTVAVSATTLTATSYTDYEDMALAVIRSKAINVFDNINAPSNTTFQVSGITITTNTTSAGVGNTLGDFTLVCAITSGTTESYVVSLNPNASNYLPNVVGSGAKDKKAKIWVQEIYPDLIKKIDSYGDAYTSILTGVSPFAYGINTTVVKASTELFKNYKTQFKTPETPWVVSQLRGNNLDRLFKFISLSDGDNANAEYKISILNIKPDTLEFDVYVRDFYDTDANPVILESFTRCTLIPTNSNYIAQKIGTSDGTYELKSQYFMLEMALDIPLDAFPCGFEGYVLSDFSSGSTGGAMSLLTPKMFYKQTYAQGEKVNKIYLGLSNSAYDGNGTKGTGINQNLFNFHNYANGNTTSGFTKTKGFHLDINATGSTYYEGTENMGEFEVGADVFTSVSDIVDSTNIYYALNTRKFTLAPAGGFDGWDVNRDSRTTNGNYAQGGLFDGNSDNTETALNDYQAWQTAINTFANPEAVTINVFATPGIDWSNDTSLVLDTIEMIELDRADSLYVIDSPDVDMPYTIGESKLDVSVANDIVSSLESAGIDSSYSCTYFPYGQMRDTQNNVYVYLPPTPEILKAIAFTDNSKFPWWAPAGLQRGSTDFKKSKYKMSLEARGILQTGRINPIVDFSDVGTAIFGQKTLQVKESALDRINVRRLLLQIKVLISNIANRLLFDPDDDIVIDQFLTKARPVLETIKRERGLYAYDIVMDSTNNTNETRDRNELYGELYLQPTRALEKIGIGLTITPTGASFKDLGI